MIWKPRNIPTFSTETGEWTFTKIEKRKEFQDFLDAQWSIPGQYNLKNTRIWNAPAKHFIEHGRFILKEEDSTDWNEYWKFEKKKVGQGIIVDNRYVPGSYYWYLNFTPIINKIKGITTFADVWDSDYHWYLYLERAQIRDLNAVTTKARQKGVSLKSVSRLQRNLWFIPNSKNKMIAYEEDYVNDKGSWAFANIYRDFLNEHTGWYRNFSPDESGNWVQRVSYMEGTDNRKEVTRGRKSSLTYGTAKKNPAKSVGGGIYELFCEESGIFPNLDKLVEFAESATKMGGTKTGFVNVIGSVGQLKDCIPLEKFSLNPEQYGFFGVDDVFSEIPMKEKIGFFWPDYWNYIHKDPDSGEVIYCYDEDGNSDIELAKTFLLIEEEKQKDKDTYTLWKSQHPWNLQDAFAIREENIWPVKIIKEHQTFIRQTYRPLCVEIIEDPDDKTRLIHRLSKDKPVSKLTINPKEDNRGVVELDELPPENPKWGVYYAGIDPIRNTNTVTSKSLMSVTVWKAAHINKYGQFVSDYPVARYTGRHFNWEDTYRVCINLCRYYNARIAVESNVQSFTNWAVQQGYSNMLMHRREILILNELLPKSTISDEIGVRMEGSIKERALEFGVGYVDAILSSKSKTDEEGNEITEYIYGVSQLRDVMLMEEMLKYNPSLNTDRIISWLLGLMACRSNTIRGLIIKEDPTEGINRRRFERNTEPTLRQLIGNHFNSPSHVSVAYTPTTVRNPIGTKLNRRK
jgi:hypothetical protein